MQRLQNNAIQQFLCLLQNQNQNSVNFFPQSTGAYPHVNALHGMKYADGYCVPITGTLEMATEWRQRTAEEETTENRVEQNESPSSDKSPDLVNYI